MATKDSKVERVKYDKKEHLLTGNPPVLAGATIANVPVGGVSVAAAAAIVPVVGVAPAVFGVAAAFFMESHVRERYNENGVTLDKSGEGIQVVKEEINKT